MSQPSIEMRPISLSTQSFLILCRLFDACYDKLCSHQHSLQVTESTAEALLEGVQFLKREQRAPQIIQIKLSFPQALTLRKLVDEASKQLPSQQANSAEIKQWLEECQEVLEQVFS